MRRKDPNSKDAISHVGHFRSGQLGNISGTSILSKRVYKDASFLIKRIRASCLSIPLLNGGSCDRSEKTGAVSSFCLLNLLPQFVLSLLALNMCGYGLARICERSVPLLREQKGLYLYTHTGSASPMLIVILVSYPWSRLSTLG